ncbi:MAG: glycoside hydrolase family 88 protein, partial [Lachnospiraceae bacterium]|nr:glycoside hydrolase family 88 protein [Lachnospiraceae bacterium]
MLDYLMKKAPRTYDGIICHNNISFVEGFSPYQLWIDGLYMVPPFLAAMGCIDEAAEQVRGYYRHLYDEKAELFYHIVDAVDGRFIRKLFWATGNGWALMGLARMIEEAERQKREDIEIEMRGHFKELLNSLLKYQLPDGRFRDILDDTESFTDGTSAMMVASCIYRGNANGYLDHGTDPADKAYETVTSKIDEYGLIREVCGCPDFVKEGTSAEAQASYIMADAWRNKV